MIVIWKCENNVFEGARTEQEKQALAFSSMQNMCLCLLPLRTIASHTHINNKRKLASEEENVALASFAHRISEHCTHSELVNGEFATINLNEWCVLWSFFCLCNEGSKNGVCGTSRPRTQQS